MFPDHLKKLGEKRIQPYQTEGFVPGKGPKHAEIMVIGEAPGRNEVEQGVPFIGQAGEKLTEFFESIGVDREELYITSVVRSRPYKVVETTDRKGNPTTKTPNRTPNQKEILAHAPLLDYQIDEMNPKILITLGNIALRRLIGKDYKISDVHGTVLNQPIYKWTGEENESYELTEESYTIFPMYHPAAVLYNGSLRDTIYQDFENLKQWLNR
ncbi:MULTISPECIES: uracil-DNA glycosylase [Pontibacillus]|uniref:Type-4 uracil-DNA glycosylase n=1 Tax=Pontibacillus chungwhensis TaxID=265426 RepID=A0ABY8UXT5_9BACI|nr:MULTISPECIES: uracil-DNA glycosylase [Pontibacillus]MCD5325784.1 uracil-DNA glycosylase [Pontibacillus sp. HN14]WIF98317.1 uracil-DNA glycosylase [Pontibacillus chungwhensis]